MMMEAQIQSRYCHGMEAAAMPTLQILMTFQAHQEEVLTLLPTIMTLYLIKYSPQMAQLFSIQKVKQQHQIS